MNFDKKKAMIAAAVVAVIAIGIYMYKGKSIPKLAENKANPLEGKTIYNPNIAETEGKVWTLINGVWYRPSNWSALPDKRETLIIPQDSYTKADFIKFPKGGDMDYLKLPQFA